MRIPRNQRALYRRIAVLSLGSLLVLSSMAVVTWRRADVQAASAFASPAFQQQWNSVESVIPNFWGPLSTAQEGQSEPYVEGTYNGQSGARLVQYFDKARMELTNPTTGTVTNGLLAVELKTGQLQLGDNSFQQRAAAAIGIAGDPGAAGPTYASLAQLPEKTAQAGGSVNLGYDVATNTFVTTAPATDPATTFGAYISDPGGRFGQNVPQAFVDFLNRIPGGYLTSMGYPISPAFAANVQVAGVPNVPVIIQAFQRKVLTYTASNPAAFKVEFGNIGQHYYQWRYNGGGATAVTPTTASGPISAPSFTNVTDTSATVVYTTSFPACGTAEYRILGSTTWTTNIDTVSCATGAATTTQAVSLSGLTGNTTYEVRPAVKDVTQTISYGPIGTFTTAATTATTTPTTAATAVATTAVATTPVATTPVATTPVATTAVATTPVTGSTTPNALPSVRP